MCVAHNTVSVRWWRVLWARCFVTWCGPYSTEPSKSRMSGSPDDQSLGREAFSFRPLPLQNRIGGRFVNLASKQKEWRRSWLGNIVLRQFWASWKLLLFRWLSAHRSSPWFCMLSQRGECVGLQHVFVCYPLDQLPACDSREEVISYWVSTAHFGCGQEFLSTACDPHRVWTPEYLS